MNPDDYQESRSASLLVKGPKGPLAGERYLGNERLTIQEGNGMETPRNHILYIEDHDDTRELVTLILSELNYRITTSSNIADALKLAREHEFDLYMLDSWLPDGSGVDLCKRLREVDRSTPIMFFSAAAYDSDKQNAIESGAQCYLIKPADPDVLCTEVSGLINGFGRRRNTMEEPN